MADIERKTNNWLPKEMVDRGRVYFCEKQRKHFVELFNQNQLLSDCSTEEIELISELLSRFLFGVQMAYFRFGFKFPNLNFAFVTNEDTDYHGIAFNPEFNGFYIKVNFLKDIIQSFRSGGGCFIQGAGMSEKITVEDFLEIVGVEEASHLMFYNEKRYMGKEEIPQEDKILQYFSSEMEFKALVWKLAYVKRYFPQYYGLLKPTYEATRKIVYEASNK